MCQQLRWVINYMLTVLWHLFLRDHEELFLTVYVVYFIM